MQNYELEWWDFYRCNRCYKCHSYYTYFTYYTYSTYFFLPLSLITIS